MHPDEIKRLKKIAYKGQFISAIRSSAKDAILAFEAGQRDSEARIKELEEKLAKAVPLLDVLRCAEAWQEAYKGRWMKAFSSQNEINDSLIAVSNSEIDLFAAIERAKQEIGE